MYEVDAFRNWTRTDRKEDEQAMSPNISQELNQEHQPPGGGAPGAHDRRSNDEAPMPSITVDRTVPYADSPVNEVVRGAYGATEDEVSREEETIASTFSDTEPGAGPNYGAAGDPSAPNLGGLEDETTLGPCEVRPPSEREVREGRFSVGGGESSFRRLPQSG
jgi:hypothetical protein